MVMLRKLIFTIYYLLITSPLLHAQIYIAPDGLDINPGTIDEPYGSFAVAISALNPGDTIYVRGGVYNLASTITINATKSGTDSARSTMTAFQDEIPLLDFSAQSLGARGIVLKANYFHFIGLQIKGAGDNGMNIDFGSNNIIERCVFFENRDSGLQLSKGSANNRIINCDSYYNADPPEYADADGFAPKLTVGSGNYFYGCRAWGNCDDGWDGYLRGADNVTTTLENCWTWHNGYLKDGSDAGPNANGNGFKMGGGDDSNLDSLMHHFIVINCVAFNNKAKGFDQNNNLGSMTLYNCTGYGNLVANYRIQRSLVPGQTLTVKNCASYNGLVQLGSFAVQETNSWLSPFEVTADDFVSLSIDSVTAARQADGSLPPIGFLHLAQGSDLIDGGIDLGFSYKGEAPDLGAFESDYITSIPENTLITNYQLFQNYPNPFNPDTKIQFTIPRPEFVTLEIFNLLGQKVVTLLEREDLQVGNHTVQFNASALASGMYFYKLQAGQEFVQVKKMVFVK
jgi:hypothetical protein